MIHDPFYKRLLGHPRIVRDIIEVALSPKRGAAWLDGLDFETLDRRPTEGVADDLRRRLQDMVWSVDAVGADGQRQRLHLLIEHQSTVDHAMPLRFLDYGSMLFRRLYDDDRRGRWREGDETDPVACVVLYNGEREWTAATGLAVGRGIAAFDARYDVVDLVRLADDDALRGRALWQVARLESVPPSHLPALVYELGAWLAAERELELTRCLDVRVAQLGAKWGLALPTLARYEEVGIMLEERIDRWEAEIMQRGVERGIERGIERGLEQGIERGVAREKALLRRQALRRFGATAAERLTVALDDVRDADQLVLAGDWIVDSVDAEDFLSRVVRGGAVR